MPNVTGTIELGSGALKNVKVELWVWPGARASGPSHTEGASSEPFTARLGAHQVAGTGRTDARGQFSIAPTREVAEQDGCMIAIKLEDADNRIVKVTYNGTNSWSVPYPGDRFLPQPLGAIRGTIDFPDATPSNTRGVSTRGAGRIYQLICQGYDYWQEQGFSQQPSSITVHVPADLPSSFGGAAFDQSTLLMRVTPGSVGAEPVILHEYGHHLLAISCPDTNAIDTSGHTWDGPASANALLNRYPFWDVVPAAERQAWLRQARSQLGKDFVEAYCSFIAMCIRASGSRRPSTRFAHSLFEADVERESFIRCASGSPAGATSYVQSGYGWGDLPSLAYLWDLVDSGRDGGQDSVQMTFAQVHRACMDSRAKTTPMLHDYLLRSGPASARAGLPAVADLNFINYAVYTEAFLENPPIPPDPDAATAPDAAAAASAGGS